MATADNKQILFSKQYIGQLITKVVKIDSVVQHLIASKTLSEAETCSLRDHKVADSKFRQLLSIITDHCNRKDLKALKTFVEILEDTGNIDVAHQVSLIYKERVSHVAILNRLSKEQSLVEDLENKINHLKRILEEKERYIESVRCENKKLADHYRKVADDQEKTFREEKLSLEKQINKNKEDLLIVEKEKVQLTSNKNDLESEVKLKSNVIRKRDKEIVEKEREVWEAIEESNGLRLKIDKLQQQHSEDKEMSRKIETLEDELAEKENTIMNLRKNKTMTREEIENIMEGQEKKIDDLTTMVIKQNDKIDLLTDTVTRAFNLQ